MDFLVKGGAIAVKGGVLGLFLIVSLFCLPGITRARPYKNIRQIALIIVTAAVAVGYFLFLKVPVNLIFAAVFGGAGLIAGYFCGNASKAWQESGIVYLKRFFLPALLLVIAYLESLFLLMFGSKTLMSIGMLSVVFGASCFAASLVSETLKARKLTVNG